VNFALGPDGDSAQIGLDGADVLGRLHWLAAGSLGNAAGPRGATVAAARLAKFWLAACGGRPAARWVRRA